MQYRYFDVWFNALILWTTVETKISMIYFGRGPQQSLLKACGQKHFDSQIGGTST